MKIHFIGIPIAKTPILNTNLSEMSSFKSPHIVFGDEHKIVFGDEHKIVLRQQSKFKWTKISKIKMHKMQKSKWPHIQTSKLPQLQTVRWPQMQFIKSKVDPSVKIEYMDQDELDESEEVNDFMSQIFIDSIQQKINKILTDIDGTQKIYMKFLLPLQDQLKKQKVKISDDTYDTLDTLKHAKIIIKKISMKSLSNCISSVDVGFSWKDYDKFKQIYKYCDIDICIYDTQTKKSCILMQIIKPKLNSDDFSITFTIHEQCKIVEFIISSDTVAINDGAISFSFADMSYTIK